MSDAPPPVLHSAFDRLVVSDRRLFGWGWAAHPTRRICAIGLRVESRGEPRRIAAGYGLSRPDVEAAHPALPDGGASGFLVTGFLGRDGFVRLWLEIEYEDGGREEFDVTETAKPVTPQRTRRRHGWWMLQAIWRRLKIGDVRGIMRRARARVARVPSLGELALVSEIAPALRKSGTACVVFDHDMGGGANQYRNGTIASRVASGQAVVLCTYNLPALEYRLRLLVPGEPERTYGCASFLVLESLLAQAPVAEMFVNSPVSFDEPLVLAEWLARMRAEHPATRLTVTMHDYFAVCPSFVLLDADGRHCGVPALSRCDECLPRHRASFVSLTPPTQPAAWRASWGRCLQAADEVRCFSGASRDLTLRAYPGLDRARVTVVPHRIDFAPVRVPRLNARAPLVIGVVGEISFQKGAHVVREMLERIERDHPDVRIVVLGTLDVASKSPRLKVTGRYERAQLPELVERHGINMFLFPSIWPETFSYVVAELAALEVPIVAFDLGAPAERLRRYPRARLVTPATAEAALAAAIDFHRELAAPRATAA